MRECKFCDKKFNEPSSFKRHIKNIHFLSNDIASKPFRCKKCMKEFKKKDFLQKHWQTHK